MLPHKYNLTPFYFVLLQGTETSRVMGDHISRHCCLAKWTHKISHHNLCFPLHHINSGLQRILECWNWWYEGLQNETTATSWCAWWRSHWSKQCSSSQLPSARTRAHLIRLTAKVRLWPQDASSLTSRHFRQTAAELNEVKLDPLCKYQRKDQAIRLQSITSDPSVSWRPNWQDMWRGKFTLLAIHKSCWGLSDQPWIRFTGGPIMCNVG